MKDSNRQLDLSAKFIQMGQALMEEGKEANNSTITLVGTNLIFLGGIVLSDKDVRKFSELISMFSAKKLLDAMGEFDNMDIRRMKEVGEHETYDSIISRLKKLKDDGENKNDAEDNEDNEDEEDLN
jgi:hypothetical protein